MNKTKNSLGLVTAILFGLCQFSEARKKEEIPLTAQGQKLLATYTEVLEKLRTEIQPSHPQVDETKKAAFIAAHAAVVEVPVPPNPQKLKNGPRRYAPSNPDYAEAQTKALLAARAILADADPFLARDKLHPELVKCALISHATPRGLAEYAQQGQEQEAIITSLLANESLMKQIMEMGGAYEGKYGEAMEVYTAIQKASKRSNEGFYQRWALAVSLEDPEREPTDSGLSAEELGISEAETNSDEANVKLNAADEMVELYLSYEKAYKDGELDPAFDSLTDFEFRFVFPERWSAADAAWMRKMMRNYRPDHIVNPDYKWRYCGIVKTDVPYTSNATEARNAMAEEHKLSSMQSYFLIGGICGPRAFVGKLSTAAFGNPTRGARQTGHAAMARWTPDGWTTVLGGPWAYNSWRGRSGLDFVLETKARKVPEEYMKMLRAEWLGDAHGEESVHTMDYGTGGGFWKALSFYKKLAIVEDAEIEELGPTGEQLAESNETTVEEGIPQIEIPEKDKTMVFAENGTITIPVAACSTPESTEKVRFMHSIDGGVQAHYNLAGKRPELLRYTVEVPAAGKYELTSKVVTVTLNGDFLLRLNRRTMVDVKVPYTMGEWQRSEPVTIDLKEGRNSLLFTIKPPNKGLTIKDFTLKPVSH